MFETKDRRTLFLGAAVVVLAIVVIVEGMYIWQHGHRAPGRFKAVNEWGEWDGLLAFDTATGQLCRRTRWKPSPTRNAPETHPAQESQPSKSSGDPILDAIVGRHVDTEAAGMAARAKEADEAAQYAREVEFVRSLPACADIR